MPLVTLAAGTARRSEVNANFALCVLTDTAKTITVTHTYTASQTFTGGWTAGAACTISTGGLTISAGTLIVSGAASNSGANSICWGGRNQSTVGAAGGASALPATPAGYAIINVDGTDRVIPFYAKS
jgi:hypothetical protein